MLTRLAEMLKKRRKESRARTRLRTPALSGYTEDPQNLDDSDDQRNASSSSHGIDHTGFVGGSTPPILELGVAQKLSEFSTLRDDPSAPPAFGTPDGHFSGKIANTADLTSSSLTAPPAAHQGPCRASATVRTDIWNAPHEKRCSMMTTSTILTGRVLPANRRPAEQQIDRIESDAVLPLYNLHTLEPSEKRLHKLGAQPFNRSSVLNRLTLSGNAIASLHPLAFRDRSNVKELHLSGNELTPAPDAPRDLALLKILDHGGNRSSLYSSSFRNLDPLTGNHYEAGGFLAANYGKQQQQDKYITSDFEILGSSDSIEIPQTQYLLNQTSHENNMTTETAHVQNSLPDFNSKRLKFEIDSGTRAVTSSENASLCDVSPEEKETFATENQLEGHCLDDADALENANCSSSNLNSPKKKNLTTSDSSHDCSLTSMRTVASLDHSIGVHDLHANNEANVRKLIPRISSNFNGTNENFVGATYGNGQISVCDSKQSGFQLNCMRNWKSMSSSIDGSISRNLGAISCA
ncbi:hypothetical protein K0M31_001979 [Melipona bicolor]|uniref:Uncharacterized protein n=1 Tax=Melipona bicolor TaxID=60889 RepID=A0AA40GHQ1_9HYME|nr:hypothetical protein K0M31_001979 [Melipona bicolor]